MKKLMMSASLFLALQNSAFALATTAPVLDDSAALPHLSIDAASADMQALAPYLDATASATGRDGQSQPAAGPSPFLVSEEPLPQAFHGASGLMASATQAIKFNYSDLPETGALSMLLLGLALVGLTVRRNNQGEKFH